MKRRVGRGLGLIVSISLGLGVSAPGAGAAGPAATLDVGSVPVSSQVAHPADTATAAPSPDSGVDLPRPVHGRNAVRLLGDDADEAAALNQMPVGRFLAILRNDPTAWLDTDARVFYREPVVEATPPADEALAATAPLDQTFLLHSKPGAQRTIFLDFDGATASGTAWHANFSGTPTSQPPWDPSGNGPEFDDSERVKIQAVWEGVAEDYAPFDVDVTTADPGPAGINRSDHSDQTYGSHVVITPSAGAWNATCAKSCGGIAYLNVFGETLGVGGDDYGYGYYQPAWVFTPALYDSVKNITEATTHEVGHNLGLSHDGIPSQGVFGEYYSGHGAWAPIMGSAYTHPISQWSKGDYLGANNHEDDVAVLVAKLGLRVDESGGSIAEAGALPRETAYITDRNDVDTYLLGSCVGPVNLSATPTASTTNLDLSVSLVDAEGATIGAADPASGFDPSEPSVATGMAVALTVTVPPGSYYLQVDGVGSGPWTTGYDDYGSLGAYRVAVAGNCAGGAPIGAPAAPRNVTVTPSDSELNATVAWTEPTSEGDSAISGYRLTRGGDGTGVVSVDVGPETRGYTWTDLAPATSYTFNVSAANALGVGTAAVATATTADILVPPGPPQDITASWASLIQRVLFSFRRVASIGSHPVLRYELFIDGEFRGTIEPGSLRFGGNLSAGPHVLGVSAVSVAGAGPRAEVTLVVPERPANDGFEQRIDLPGPGGITAGDNLEATREYWEPDSPYLDQMGGQASVWYSWTAPASGPVTFWTGSDEPGRDTTLVVYTGSYLNDLTQVAANDNADGGLLARVGFIAGAGTTYTLQVNGFRAFSEGVGPFTLSWSGAPPIATDTALEVSRDRRSVVLSATVSSTSGPPPGTIVFRDGEVVVGTTPAQSGAASLVVENVPTGEHRYSAEFVPTEPGFAGSRSEAVDLTVAASATTATFDATAGVRSVAFAAGVASPDGVPAGRVDVLEGDQVVGSAELDGEGDAALTITAEPGEHTYAAIFVPVDDTYASSTSASRVVDVQDFPPVAVTATTLSVDVVRRTVTLTAGTTSAAGDPHGAVQIVEDGVVVDTVELIGGTAAATRTAVAAGDHTWTATFVPADPTAYEASTSAAHTRTVAATVTTTSLTGTVSGTTATLALSVTGTDGLVPDGLVELYDADVLVATAQLAGGVATIVVPGLTVGTHALQARFVPASADYLASDSPVRSLSVAEPVVASRTTITAPRTAKPGTRPVVKVKVLRGAAPAAGQVVLRYGTRTVLLTLRSGVASFRLPRLRAGTLKLTASYRGNATTKPSVGTRSIAVRR